MNIVYITKELMQGTCSLAMAGHRAEWFPSDAITAAEKYDVLVTDLNSVSSELIDRLLPHLKIVATLTTGTDHIDTTYLKEKGIRLVTLLDCEGIKDITSTAEHALGLMLALSRNYKKAFHSPTLPRDSLRGHELRGKTLGVIGKGRVGEWLSRYAEILGIKTLYYDPRLPGSLPLWQLLELSDFVSINATLNESSTGMLTTERLSGMKPTAYLINTARGQIIEDGALLEALEHGTIAGAASDFYDEDLLAYAQEHDNLILTPHLGGATFEGLEKADALIANKLKDILHESNNKTTQETIHAD